MNQPLQSLANPGYSTRNSTPCCRIQTWPNFNLYPVANTGREGLFFVFLKEDNQFDPATALQRYMVQVIEAGRPLRSSGMLLFVEDLTRNTIVKLPPTHRNWPKQ